MSVLPWRVPVFYPRDAGRSDRAASLPDPAARTHGPVGNRPHGVAPKFGGRLTPFHWLNAKIVGAHLAKHTTEGR